MRTRFGDLDAAGRPRPHCAPCTALTTFAAFAGRLFASDNAGCGRLFSDREFWDARPAGRRALRIDFDPMELKLYDTLTREKRLFKPLDPANVRMYVCGPTVYDFAHIGNARPVIVFDVLFRLLRHLYGADHVTYVRNITDVDDKINARAAEEFPGLPLNEAIRRGHRKDRPSNFTRTWPRSAACRRPSSRARPSISPRCATLIERLIKLRQRLCRRRQCAVHRVPSMPDYGRLSKRPLDEMIAGARVEVAPYKTATPWISCCGSRRSPASRPGRRPSGIVPTPGRPGWHIECSAMSWTSLSRPRSSTSMAAASISSFRITRTKSRNRVAPSIRR